LNSLLRICPLAWAFKASRLEPDTVPVATTLGSAIHVAHAYARAVQKRGDAVVLLAEMKEVFVDAWDEMSSDPRIPLVSGEREKTRVEGLALVEQLHKNLSSEEILGIEEPFRIALADDEGPLRPLVGYLDLIVRDAASGIVTVVDLKSSARAFGASKTEHDLQSTCYLMAGRQRFGPAVQFRFDVVTKTVPARFQRVHVTRGEDDFRRLVALVRVAERMVLSGAIFPREDWACSGCGYRAACRAWHEQVPAPTAEPALA
jgi:putative RecB family exonuclease